MRAIALVLVLWAVAIAPPARAEGLETLHLPPGFHVTEYASDLAGIRMMALSPHGELTVSQPRSGRVLLLPDAGGKAGTPHVLVDGLSYPHGLAWRGTDLYVAETRRVIRLELDAARRRVVRRVEIASLPPDGMHITRTIRFGPDGWLYVTVGSSCNACNEKDPERAAMLRMRADGTGREIYARGLRNAVGFTWDRAGRLWATDNGTDWLGNDLPPDEFDLIERGRDYGWPRCWGDRQPDPRVSGDRDCGRTTPPALSFPAHVAPLGLTFYSGAMFPADYKGDAFVACHGSWNRNPKAGYEVLRVRFEEGRPTRWEPFITGWLRGDSAWGRPVDVLQAPDGALLVTDDAGGRIYRVSR